MICPGGASPLFSNLDAIRKKLVDPILRTVGSVAVAYMLGNFLAVVGHQISIEGMTTLCSRSRQQGGGNLSKKDSCTRTERIQDARYSPP